MASFSISASKIGAGLQEDFTPRRSSELTDLSVAGAPGNALTGVGNATIQFAKVRLAEQKQEHLITAKRNFDVEAKRLIVEANEQFPLDPRFAQASVEDQIAALAETYGGDNPEIVDALKARASLENLSNRDAAVRRELAMDPVKAKNQALLSKDSILSKTRGSPARAQAINEFIEDMLSRPRTPKGIKNRLIREVLVDIEVADYADRLEDPAELQGIVRRGVTDFDSQSLLSTSQKKSIVKEAGIRLAKGVAAKNKGLSSVIESVGLELDRLTPRIMEGIPGSADEAVDIVTQAYRRLARSDLALSDPERHKKIRLQLSKHDRDIASARFAGGMIARVDAIVNVQDFGNGDVSLQILHDIVSNFVRDFDFQVEFFEEQDAKFPEIFGSGTGATRRRAIEKKLIAEGTEAAEFAVSAIGRLDVASLPDHVSLVKDYVDDIEAAFKARNRAFPREGIDKEIKERMNELQQKELGQYIRAVEVGAKADGRSFNDAEMVQIKDALRQIADAYPGSDRGVLNSLLKGIEDGKDAMIYNDALLNGRDVTPGQAEKYYEHSSNNIIRGGRTLTMNDQMAEVIANMPLDSPAYPGAIARIRALRNRAGASPDIVESTLRRMVNSKDPEALMRAAQISANLGAGINIRSGSQEAGLISSQLATAWIMTDGLDDANRQFAIAKNLGFQGQNRHGFEGAPLTVADVTPYVKDFARTGMESFANWFVDVDPSAIISPRVYEEFARLGSAIIAPHGTDPEDALDAAMATTGTQLRGQIGPTKFSGSPGDAIVLRGLEILSAKPHLKKSGPTDWVNNSLARAMFSDVTRRGLFKLEHNFASAIATAVTDLFGTTEAETIAELTKGNVADRLWFSAQNELSGNGPTTMGLLAQHMFKTMRDQGRIVVTNIPGLISPNGDPVFQVVYTINNTQYIMDTATGDGGFSQFYSPNFSNTPESIMEMEDQERALAAVKEARDFRSLANIGRRIKHNLGRPARLRDRVLGNGEAIDLEVVE
jgi:hypothetical protein